MCDIQNPFLNIGKKIPKNIESLILEENTLLNHIDQLKPKPFSKQTKWDIKVDLLGETLEEQELIFPSIFPELIYIPGNRNILWRDFRRFLLTVLLEDYSIPYEDSDPIFFSINLHWWRKEVIINKHLVEFIDDNVFLYKEYMEHQKISKEKATNFESSVKEHLADLHFVRYIKNNIDKGRRKNLWSVMIPTNIFRPLCILRNGWGYAPMNEYYGMIHIESPW